jgi:tetratricopeptide (TPR) repeat protein
MCPKRRKESKKYPKGNVKRSKSRKHPMDKGNIDKISKGRGKHKYAKELPQKRIIRRRLWLFRIIAVTVIPALLFFLVEVTLRIAGYGFPTAAIIKCKVKGTDSCCDNIRFSWQFFPPNIARSADPFVFPAEKSDNTCRIFIMGASAAAGTPEGAYSFGRILQVMLRQQYPQVNFEVIIDAMPAINSHMVLEIMKDCARQEPDLFIVYLGNNEVVGPYGAGTVFTPLISNLSFIRLRVALKSTKLGQLMTNLMGSIGAGDTPKVWRGMQMFIEKQVRADDRHLENVYRHFRRNLEDISRVARKNRTNIIFCTVGCNLKDSPPFTSLHRPDITEAEQKKWDDIYKRGIEYESAGNYADAVKQYLEAAEIDGCYADLRFRMGRCYWEMEQYDKAKIRYIQARELDTLRFRADNRINEIIRNVAVRNADNGVYLVDIVKILEDNSPHGITGQELFYEHVHMNFKGNYLLAKAVFSQAVEILPERIKQYRADRISLLSESECVRYLAYTDWDRHKIADEVLNNFIKQAPFTNQLYHSRRVEQMEQELKALEEHLTPEVLSENEAQYRRAIERTPADIWLNWKYGEFLEGLEKNAGAAMQYRVVLDLVPHHYEAYAKLGLLLGKQGDYNSAIAYNLKAVEIFPSFAEAYFNLGFACHLQRRLDEAAEYYSKSIQFMPDQSQAYINLALIQYDQHNVTEAMETCRNGLSAKPDDLDLHCNLGLMLRDQGRRDEAIKEFRSALEIDPNSAKARKFLKDTLEGRN